MSKFTFPESIRSRPVYGTLELRAGAAHLLIADAYGAEAILDVAPPEMMANAHIIYPCSYPHLPLPTHPPQ